MSQREHFPTIPAGKMPDHMRQLDMLDPSRFKTPVHVIGVGATGSWIAWSLLKMGIPVIVYDDDVVERHNCPNQVYGLCDIGKFKVDALRERVYNDTGISISVHRKKWDPSMTLSGIVFVCVDSMSARRQIWKEGLMVNLNVELVVETRLGSNMGSIYTLNPMMLSEIKNYEKTLYSDDSAADPVCTNQAICSMVLVLAGLASDKVSKFSRGEKLSPVVQLTDSGKQNANFDVVCVEPKMIMSSDWRKYHDGKPIN